MPTRLVIKKAKKLQQQMADPLSVSLYIKPRLNNKKQYKKKNLNIFFIPWCTWQKIYKEIPLTKKCLLGKTKRQLVKYIFKWCTCKWCTTHQSSKVIESQIWQFDILNVNGSRRQSKPMSSPYSHVLEGKGTGIFF